MKPVVIFAATRWELRAVHRAFPTAHATTLAGHRSLIARGVGRTVLLVQTGIGPVAAAQAATAVMDSQPVESVISAGFACAMIPAQVGDLMLGADVASVQRNGAWVLDRASIHCDDALRGRLLSAARQAGLPVSVGLMISTPAVVGSAEEKCRLSRLSGALGLDMESAALAAIAADRGVPFGIARAVSDLLDEDLPLDFNLFLNPGGWLRGLQGLLTHPGSLAALNRLRKQSGLASDRLTQLFAAYGAADEVLA